MKASVAGCAIGRPLVKPPTRVGHEVVCMVWSAKGACRLRQLGAEPARPLAVLVADRGASLITDDRRGVEP